MEEMEEMSQTQSPDDIFAEVKDSYETASDMLTAYVEQLKDEFTDVEVTKDDVRPDDEGGWFEVTYVDESGNDKRYALLCLTSGETPSVFPFNFSD